MNETKEKPKRRYKGRTDGRYKPFDTDPEWSDMLAMIRHYGQKDEAWLERQANQFAVSKKKDWEGLQPKLRCQFANDVHTMIHTTAVAQGWAGKLFAVREEYND